MILNLYLNGIFAQNYKRRFMKKYLLAILIILSIICPVGAQSVGKWRAGSASELKGNIYTLSCFISEEGKESWTHEEKLKVLDKQKEALAWIKEQANTYRVEVNFDAAGNFGLQEDIKMPVIERGTASGKEPVDWVSRVLYKLGYKSTLDLVAWVEKNTKAKQVQVIIYAKGKGNGYAMASSTEMNKERFFVEGAILYEKYNSGGSLAASSIAHETLHLYGAWDLYKTFSQSAENEKKAKELFPNSIMLRTSYNITELEVDEVSAWLIGWNQQPKSWYETLRPSRK